MTWCNISERYDQYSKKARAAILRKMMTVISGLVFLLEKKIENMSKCNSERHDGREATVMISLSFLHCWYFAIEFQHNINALRRTIIVMEFCRP